jgi:hypothetical protein
MLPYETYIITLHYLVKSWTQILDWIIKPSIMDLTVKIVLMMFWSHHYCILVLVYNRLNDRIREVLVWKFSGDAWSSNKYFYIHFYQYYKNMIQGYISLTNYPQISTITLVSLFNAIWLIFLISYFIKTHIHQSNER